MKTTLPTKRADYSTKLGAGYAVETFRGSDKPYRVYFPGGVNVAFLPRCSIMTTPRAMRFRTMGEAQAYGRACQTIILTKPLTKKEIEMIVGKLSVNIVVDLNQIIGCGDMDGLNDIAENLIVEDRAVLGEIEYRALGVVPEGAFSKSKSSMGSIILNVTCGVWEPL
jgi:hypothetical protein